LHSSEWYIFSGRDLNSHPTTSSAVKPSANTVVVHFSNVCCVLVYWTSYLLSSSLDFFFLRRFKDKKREIHFPFPNNYEFTLGIYIFVSSHTF
jgi:hypothetical protein